MEGKAIDYAQIINLLRSETYLMLNIYWSTKQQNRVGWNNSCISKEHFSCLNLQLYKQEFEIKMSKVWQSWKNMQRGK